MSNEPDHTDTPSDSSPYIRTYAKDFAALSGKRTDEEKSHDKKKKKGEPVEVPLPPPPPELQPKTLQEEFPGGSAAQTLMDATFNPKDETLNLDSYDTKTSDIDVFSLKNKEDTEREKILARLKEKVKSTIPTAPNIETSAAPVAPVEVAPQEPVRVPEVIEPLPAPQRPTQIPPELTGNFHSFSTDFADRIDQQQASTFSVLAAEKDAKTQHVVVERKKSSLVPIVLGIVLCLGGAAGIYVAYSAVNSHGAVTLAPAAPTLVSADQHVTLAENANLLQALSQQASVSIPENSITLATYSSTSTAIDIPAPDILLRNIDSSSEFGIVHAGNETRPFFILHVTSYERTFAGMLQWENTMQQNLASLYPLYAAQPIQQPSFQTASSTASSTQPAIVEEPESAEPATQFVDEIVANHNARALKDTDGRTLIIYGYADQQTLIIARDEASFSLLLSRLTTNA